MALLTLARVLCWLYSLALLAICVAAGRFMVVGLGWCRVVAAYVSSGSMLAKFFITISHCPWRDFISLSNGDKETKQRKRLPTICIKCPQRADHCFWFPRRTVLAKPRTVETLLLANPDIPTLRHQWSRARSIDHGPARSHALFLYFTHFPRWRPRDPRDQIGARVVRA